MPWVRDDVPSASISEVDTNHQLRQDQSRLSRTLPGDCSPIPKI